MRTDAGDLDEPLEHLLSTAHALADAARPLALRWFREPLVVENKDDASPVTEADRAIETAMRRLLAERHPHHGVYGEEYGQERPDSRHLWVLDPIDGTRSFITGQPLFGCLIACLDRGDPVVGVIEMPALSERFAAARGFGSRFWPNHATARPSGGARVIRTRAARGLKDAALYLSPHPPMDEHERAAFGRLEAAVGMSRIAFDCYGFGQLAAGWIDAVVETGLAPYDYMALVPVIEEAGGLITDWSGRPLSLESEGDVVASATPALHEELLKVLRA